MKKILSVILCSVLMFSLVACGKSEVAKTPVKEAPVEAAKVEPKTEPEATVAKTEEVKSSDVVLYFSDDQAMYLVGEKRNIKDPTAKAIVAELLKGPSASSEGTGKLYSTLPAGVEILDVQVKDSIAYVDFKGSVSEKISGSAGESMALYSIINTLVSDKELGITKVQFLVEGKNVDSIAGHFDVSKPMSEDLKLIKK